MHHHRPVPCDCPEACLLLPGYLEFPDRGNAERCTQGSRSPEADRDTACRYGKYQRVSQYHGSRQESSELRSCVDTTLEDTDRIPQGWEIAYQSMSSPID